MRRSSVSLVLAVGLTPLLLWGASAAASSNVPVTPMTPLASSYHEPSLAINPMHPERMAISYAEKQKNQGCYLARSADGGTTWRAELLVGDGGRVPVPAGGHPCSFFLAPRVAYGADGTLFYSFPVDTTDQAGLIWTLYWVISSADDGAHFSNPIRLLPGSSGDGGEGVMAGPADDVTVYAESVVETLDTSLATKGLYISRLATTAAPSSPVQVSPTTGQFVVGPAVAAGRGGGVYAAWMDWAPTFVYQALPSILYLATSRDGGHTFGSPVLVATIERGCNGAYSQTTACKPYHFDYKEQLAAGGNSDVYFVWHTPGNLPGGGSRVFFTASHDAGATWTAPAVLGATGALSGDQQYEPAIAVAPDGRIDIIFYDVDAAARYQDVYAISSGDKGMTFSDPRRITTASSATDVHGPTDFYGSAAFGYTMALASTPGGVRAAWSDSRRGTTGTGHQDIYFTNAGTPAEAAVTAPSPPPQASAQLPSTSGPPGAATASAILTLLGIAAMLRRRRRGAPCQPLTELVTSIP